MVMTGCSPPPGLLGAVPAWEPHTHSRQQDGRLRCQASSGVRWSLVAGRRASGLGTRPARFPSAAAGPQPLAAGGRGEQLAGHALLVLLSGTSQRGGGIFGAGSAVSCHQCRSHTSG